MQRLTGKGHYLTFTNFIRRVAILGLAGHAPYNYALIILWQIYVGSHYPYPRRQLKCPGLS